MRSIDAYRKTLRKQAARRTRKLLRKASEGDTLTLTIWSKEHQDAYMAIGWHPLSESPRIEPTSGDTWSEMTLTITKA
jgi:hypothetical protein